jgi:transcription antitermination factor NusG
MPENDSTNEEKRWYIVYTNPRAEKKLSKLLNKYQIVNYLPLISEKRKWSDRFIQIETPCFKSYIFVNIKFWKERVSVLQLPGAHHFVFHKGQPATIDIETIETLRASLKARTESIQVRENEALAKGKFVKVIAGAFAGHTVEVEKRKNKVAVYVRIEILNQVVINELKIEDISWEEEIKL